MINFEDGNYTPMPDTQSAMRDHPNPNMRVMKDALRYYITCHYLNNNDKAIADKLYATLGGDDTDYA